MELTETEKRIIVLVGLGFTNVLVSKEIFMSARSVENYLAKIYDKLEVKSRSESIEKFARENVEKV